MPGASATFTINGSATTAGVSVSAGATVTLALVSTTGVRSVQWSIESGSDSTKSEPALTGDTATTCTFTMNTPVGAVGLSWLIKCVINGGVDDAGQTVSAHSATGLVGVLNSASKLPFALSERYERNPTHGIIDDINEMWTSPGADATSLRGVTLELATVGSPSAGNVIYYDGTKYVAGAPSSLTLTWTQVLADGRTTAGTGAANPQISTGDRLEFTSTTNYIYGDANGQHYVLPSGDVFDWTINAVKAAELSATALELQDIQLAFNSDGDQVIYSSGTVLKYNVPTGDYHEFQVNAVGILGIDSTAVTTGSGIDLISAGDLMVSDGGTLYLNYGGGSAELFADGGGIEYSVPTGDTHEFFVNAVSQVSIAASLVTVGAGALAIGSTVASSGALRLMNGASTGGVYARNFANTQNVSGFYLGTDDRWYVSDTAQAIGVSLLGTTTHTFQIGANTIAIVRSDQLEIQSTYALDFAGELKITRAGTDYITSSSGAVNVPIGVLTVGSNFAQSAGLIRVGRSFNIIQSRNQANTVDLLVLGIDSSNNQLVGDGTNNADVRLQAGTGVVLGSIGGSTIWTTRTTELELASTMALDFAGELKITRAGTDYITSASGVVELGVASLRFDTAVASPVISQATETTGTASDALTIQAQNNSFDTASATTGGNLILLAGDATGTGTSGNRTGGSVILSPGTASNASGGVLAPGTIQLQDAAGSNVVIVRATELELQSTYALDFAGELKITRAGTDYITSASGVVELGVASLRFDTAVASPVISQEDDANNSATGDKLVIRAQDATGTTSTGGALDIRPGTGTSTNGLGRLLNGTTQRFGWNGTGIGFYAATPVAQPSTTGETVGFTAGAGTNVTDQSTFTGNVGSTAYRLSDVVKHLKNLGLLAQ